MLALLSGLAAGWLLPLTTASAADSASSAVQIKRVLDRARDQCRYCHTFSQKQLAKQSKRARRRHQLVKVNNLHCIECHDEDEMQDIVYHH